MTSIDTQPQVLPFEEPREYRWFWAWFWAGHQV
jgi:hypothetical protein